MPTYTSGESKSQIPLGAYASWFEAGRRQVRSSSATSFEAASVMELGFKIVMIRTFS